MKFKKCGKSWVQIGIQSQPSRDFVASSKEMLSSATNVFYDMCSKFSTHAMYGWKKFSSKSQILCWSFDVYNTDLLSFSTFHPLKILALIGNGRIGPKDSERDRKPRRQRSPHRSAWRTQKLGRIILGWVGSNIDLFFIFRLCNMLPTM